MAFPPGPHVVGQIHIEDGIDFECRIAGSPGNWRKKPAAAGAFAQHSAINTMTPEDGNITIANSTELIGDRHRMYATRLSLASSSTWAVTMISAGLHTIEMFAKTPAPQITIAYLGTAPSSFARVWDIAGDAVLPSVALPVDDLVSIDVIEAVDRGAAGHYLKFDLTVSDGGELRVGSYAPDVGATTFPVDIDIGFLVETRLLTADRISSNNTTAAAAWWDTGIDGFEFRIVNAIGERQFKMRQNSGSPIWVAGLASYGAYAGQGATGRALRMIDGTEYAVWVDLATFDFLNAGEQEMFEFTNMSTRQRYTFHGEVGTGFSNGLMEFIKHGQPQEVVM